MFVSIMPLPPRNLSRVETLEGIYNSIVSRSARLGREATEALIDAHHWQGCGYDVQATECFARAKALRAHSHRLIRVATHIARKIEALEAR